ncbi:indolepyruvate ferredoxin oxidoreductase family protein [Pseudonocardia halophobica]|uniref:Indolepyruvate ferredoxin oxidoreductase n=1 Tax=Pseudonocardia halophobica TaxID=29401 RepID=A0A9W6NZ65_9PSEU|nr:indolepyruvate ferredoxin oxidoreductase family protein [Pseudonocardia halophobica]GLL14441.1 indolepyruvate ferredoxin oxidoreductase [Pseudonocardia halophobica]
MTTVEARRVEEPRPASTVSLGDRFRLDEGRVFLTGVQALVRAPLDQVRRDRRAGLRTGGFITGFPGSPLGGYDLSLKQNRTLLGEHGIVHQMGQNEELAASALMGTQLLERYPHSRYDGVTGFWYGKGPGLDRAGDSLRHGNFAGTTMHGAVVVLSGEDHEAKSSSLPYEQEYAFAHAGIPVLYPSSVEEFLTYSAHAIGMSRYSGCWVAMKLIGQLCDGGQTIDLDPERLKIVVPEFEIDGRPFRKWQDHAFFPGKVVETERHVFTERHPAAVAYAKVNGLNEIKIRGPHDTLGLVTAGKSYADTLQALRDLGIGEDDLRAAGVRLVKIGAIYPLDAEFVRESTRDLDEVVVVEEKRPILEDAIKVVLCNVASGPRVHGKRDLEGRVRFAEYGSLDADAVARGLAPVLRPRLREQIILDRRTEQLEAVKARDYSSNLKRSPNYCSGCPHNVSTIVPEGRVAWGAPGCHIFAAVMDQPERQIDATFPLGGEGVAWIGLSPFTDLEHVIQNQGDGSLFHSSYLSIRWSVAAGVKMTYRILYNGAVANTGAQEPIGQAEVPKLASLLALEGVKKIGIIAEDPAVYRRADLPSIASVHGAGDVQKVLKDLEQVDGVTVFLYDGECANERRRRRKRGTAPKATTFVVINEDVCENCGDCGEVTNCMSLHKNDTEFGPKTAIHQSSCNQDHSCLKGDCPSFLTVHSEEGFAAPVYTPLEVDAVAEPKRPSLDRPYHVFVPGVGGTGVLTLNSMLAWAALVDGAEAVSYDQTGAAQKWGAVLSSLVLSPRGERADSNKVGIGCADLYLAVDAMAAADPVNLDRCSPEHTTALVNTGLLPSGEMIRNSHLDVSVDPMIDSISRFTARTVAVDARAIAETLFGDYMATNMVAVGAAYQAGLLPISSAAIEEAIRLNGTARVQNQQAFRYGRLAVADPARVAALISPPPRDAEQEREHVRGQLAEKERAGYDALVAKVADLAAEDRRLLAVRIGELIAFQDAEYAGRYVDVVLDVARCERARLGDKAGLPITREVIRNLYKLMAYKDEYEVARLHLRASREHRVSSQFAGKVKVTYNLHPPMLRSMGMKNKLKLPARVLDPVFAVLSGMKKVRGTKLDVFGRDRIRVEERRLIDWYIDLVRTSMDELKLQNKAAVLDIARLPDGIRGYEDIKLRSAAEAIERAEVLRGRLKNTLSLPLLTTTES